MRAIDNACGVSLKKSHDMIEKIIAVLRRQRSLHQFELNYKAGYAFVGIGNHSRQNLYPVVSYLGLPLRYICLTSERKAALVAAHFPQVKVTTRLDEVLADANVRGVLVATSPQSNFAVARRALESGRTVFVEKPPCLNAAELEQLIAAERKAGVQCIVGLQKRYAPAVRMLRERIKTEQALAYTLHYRTGLYPEGDALTDLFIHPLDLVCNLFGASELTACQRLVYRDGGQTLHLQLKHDSGAVGSLELSTAYTWAEAEERLIVNTQHGIYDLQQSEQLIYSPKSRSLLGVPLEKVRPMRTPRLTLAARNSFSPLLINNSLYTQGFYDEISCFAAHVEGGERGTHAENCSSLASLRDTYALIEAIKRVS